jgi:hypothetical protein
MGERLLTSTAGPFEADVIVGRLADAGIAAYVKAPIQTRMGDVVGGRDVYVEHTLLDRARSVLEEGSGVSDDELAQLAEEAGRDGHAAED